MKILVISQYYYPEQFLINDITRELNNNGHKLTIITGLPNYPSGIIDEKYKNVRLETYDRITILRCPILPRKSGLIHLFFNYISYVVLASIKVLNLKDNYDIIFVYQLTPVLQLIPAVLFSIISKRKLVCYCLDLAPASGSGIIKKGVLGKLVYNIYKRISGFLYNHCDVICVSSKSFKEYLNEIHRIPLRKIEYLPQHAPSTFCKLNLNKKRTKVIDFMFAGNIGKGASLDTIIYAANILKNKARNKFRIHFVGDGSYKNTLKELVSKLDLNEYIIFHDSVKYLEMGEYFLSADALLVTLRRNQITVPSKLQAYMSTGKPILGAMDGSGKDLVEEVGCGKCVLAEDYDGLAEIMEEFIYNSSVFVLCGEKGRNYFEKNFTLTMFTNKLFNILGKTIKGDYDD